MGGGWREEKSGSGRVTDRKRERERERYQIKATVENWS